MWEVNSEYQSLLKNRIWKEDPSCSCLFQSFDHASSGKHSAVSHSPACSERFSRFFLCQTRLVTDSLPVSISPSCLSLFSKKYLNACLNKHLCFSGRCLKHAARPSHAVSCASADLGLAVEGGKKSCKEELRYRPAERERSKSCCAPTQALSQIRDLSIPGKLPNILSRRMRRHIRIHWNMICFLGHSKALSLLTVWSVWSPSKFSVSCHIRECLFLLCFTYHKCGLAACKKMSRKASLFPLAINFLMLERDFCI